jgi:hypothetical protein
MGNLEFAQRVFRTPECEVERPELTAREEMGRIHANRLLEERQCLPRVSIKKCIPAVEENG